MVFPQQRFTKKVILKLNPEKKSLDAWMKRGRLSQAEGAFGVNIQKWEITTHLVVSSPG